ncbi:MAG: DUF929 family protein [Acidimicrobiales bacterium]|nr:DUF929 family protein [Acidimicrobiales bacterium]
MSDGPENENPQESVNPFQPRPPSYPNPYPPSGDIYSAQSQSPYFYSDPNFQTGQATNFPTAFPPGQTSNQATKKPLFLILSVLGVLIIIAGISVAIYQSDRSGSTLIVATTTYPTNTVAKTTLPNFSEITASIILAKIEAVPISAYNAVGTGNGQVVAPPSSIVGTPLVKNGKPEILFMGALWCPFCASESWALVAALSRFGTFKGLRTTYSISNDMYPNTPAFDFHSITYTSPYISFSAVVMQNVNHSFLMSPTRQENALFNRYDSKGAIPFVDIGNSWLSFAEYSPQVLSNLTFAGIANSLLYASQPETQAILGSANYLSATICSADNFQPIAVCTSSGVVSAAVALGIHVP